ncbi:ATP-binding protein [Parvularcula mediterranea]|uniref:ATP-binding protein n=1 Tax=Parvularcula mediterranea TaxID=2732508 RepID=UPI0015630183|nr:ATP-binding protein [Parvularcula mediterranea]
MLTIVSLCAPLTASANQAGTGPEALLDQAQSILVSDTESGLTLVRRAVAAENRGPQPSADLLLRAAWLEAEALFRLGRLDEAAAHIERTLDTAPSEPTDIFGKILISSGRVARARGEDGLALKHFQEAFNTFSTTDNRRYMAIALQALGTLYTNAHQYDRAIEYIERSAAIYPDDPMLRVAGLNNRANAYRFLERWEDARRLYTEALNTDVIQAVPALELRLYGSIAAFELHAGNEDGAANAVNNMERLQADGVVTSLPLIASAVRAKLLLSSGRPQAATKVLDEAFEGMDFASSPEDAREAHELAYEVYRRAGRAESALAHLEVFQRLEAIQRNIAASANLAILNAEFELSNKELEIERLRSETLEADVALIKARRRQEQLITGAIILLALGFSCFLVWNTLQSGRVRRITERLNKELENVNQKLRISNVELEKANSAKTEFLATTSHEVRTPLNAVINLTASVLDTTSLPDEAEDKLATALKSAEHLHEIVSDVLDVARFEGKRVRAHLSNVKIETTLTDVINLWKPKAEEKDLDFDVDIDVNTKDFRTDDKLLRQVLSNLVSNAIKFTQSGSIELRATGGLNTPLRISVHDSGIGIAEENRKVIFDSFRQVDSGGTRSFAGTGLGLAICRQIVELLGGTIQLQSEIGKGSTFTVTLPVLTASKPNKPAAEPARTIRSDIDESLKGIRVLAAEDNAVNAMVIQAILKGKVGGLTIVENGLEAVNAVMDGGFDVVLMDKQMPVMDGVEAIKRIRAIEGAPARIPIIAVTADAFAEAREELYEAGADDYLSKPIKPDDLKESIVSNLDIRERKTDAAGRAKSGA